MGHMLSLAVLAVSLLIGKPWTVTGAGELTILLADGFFVSGMLLISVGGLLYVSDKGGFDMLVYTFSTVMGRKKGESYYSYVTGKRAGGKWLSPMRDGAVMIGLSAIFAAMWQIFVG